MNNQIRMIMGPILYQHALHELNIKNFESCQEYENTIQELEDVIRNLKTNFQIKEDELNSEIDYRDKTISSLHIECDRLDLRIMQSEIGVKHILENSSELQFKIENLEREIRQGD